MKNFIVDKNISKNLEYSLSKYGEIYKTGYIEFLYEPVNTHPDIQIHFFDKNNAICCKEMYFYYKNILPHNIKLICGENSVGGGYPNDASYNVAVFGNNLVCNFKYVDNNLKEYYNKKGYNLINVSQGYTKCNICIVSDNAIITEDIGIANKLNAEGIDVLLIEKGHVNMKNFKYGFIGGSTVNLSENTIGFFGDITKHIDYLKIKQFILKYNKNIISLSNEKLTDYGSGITF